MSSSVALIQSRSTSEECSVILLSMCIQYGLPCIRVCISYLVLSIIVDSPNRLQCRYQIPSPRRGEIPTDELDVTLGQTNPQPIGS